MVSQLQQILEDVNQKILLKEEYLDQCDDVIRDIQELINIINSLGVDDTPEIITKKDSIVSKYNQL